MKAHPTLLILKNEQARCLYNIQEMFIKMLNRAAELSANSKHVRKGRK